MKIAYILPSLINRGPIKVVSELVKELRQYHDIDIYYFKEQDGLIFDVSSQKISFLETIDFDDYDIIHSHGVVPDAYVWWHQKKMQKAKSVTTLHNIAHEDFKYQYHPLKAKLMLRLWNTVTSTHDMVVVLSQYAKKQYQSYWKNQNMKVVNNGISEYYALRKLEDKRVLDLKERYTMLGAIGILTKRKGFEQILNALVFLPEYALVVVGDGQEMEALKKLSETLDVVERVCFVGFQKEIYSYMQYMDILLVPSRSEGFSLVVLEALRMKKQLILSDLEIFDELFDEKEFVLDDISSLVESIKSTKIMDNDKGYQLFLERYTSKVMAKSYEKLYMEVLKNA